MSLFSQSRKHISQFGDLALELLYPTRCISCDIPGELLCEECREDLNWIDQMWACPVCGAPYGWLTCTECKQDWEQNATVSALVFEGSAAQTICAYKDEHELRLAPVMSAALLTALEEAGAWDASDGTSRFNVDAYDAVCFVPATPEAYARRGFDHMEEVARLLAVGLGLPLCDALARTSKKDQRELGRLDRRENLNQSVQVIEEVAGLSLILVDDVITTGASTRACAAALLDRGAKQVCCCSFARVW